MVSPFPGPFNHPHTHSNLPADQMEKKIIICLALTVILGIPLAYGSEVTRSFSSDIVSVGCNLTISLSVTVTENETIYN